MLSKVAKLLLVGTAFAPVLLTISWIRLIEGKFWPFGFSYLVASIFTIGICVLLIRAAAAQLELIPFSPKSVKTADTEIIGFVLAYLLPLINSSGVSIRPEVFWFVMALLGLMVWTTNSYHVNPVLGALGFHFYEVTTSEDVTYVLITRRNLRSAGKVTKAVQLTEYMILDVEARR